MLEISCLNFISSIRLLTEVDLVPIVPDRVVPAVDQSAQRFAEVQVQQVRKEISDRLLNVLKPVNQVGSESMEI